MIATAAAATAIATGTAAIATAIGTCVATARAMCGATDARRAGRKADPRRNAAQALRGPTRPVMNLSRREAASHGLPATRAPGAICARAAILGLLRT